MLYRESFAGPSEAESVSHLLGKTSLDHQWNCMISNYYILSTGKAAQGATLPVNVKKYCLIAFKIVV